MFYCQCSYSIIYLQFSTRCALFEMVFSIAIDFVLLTNYSKCIFLYRIDVTSITFRGVGVSLEVSILIVLGHPHLLCLYLLHLWRLVLLEILVVVFSLVLVVQSVLLLRSEQSGFAAAAVVVAVVLDHLLQLVMREQELVQLIM